MKKFFITLIIFPILIMFGSINSSFKFLKSKNYSDLEIESIVDLEFSADGNTNGAVVDTNGDQNGDTIYMWGQNNNYQIGDGTATDKFSPVEITPQGQSSWGGDIINLEIAQLFSGATVDSNYDGYADTLYLWGSNYRGEIGNGETTGSITTPQVITPEGSTTWDGNIINFSLMYANTAVLIDTDYDGYGDLVYGWGENTDYEISPKDDNAILYPEIIAPEDNDWGGNIIDLKLGSRFGGVTVDSNYDGLADMLYMWGDNSYGELGLGASYQYSQYPTIVNPQSGSWDGDIIDLTLGFFNSGLLIDTDSDGIGDLIYSWGQNNYGQLGDGTNIIRYSPKIITPSSGSWGGNILQFEKGSYTSGVIIDSDLNGSGDLLYMWGQNGNGQLGAGSTSDISTPTIIYPEGQSSWPGSIYSLSNGFSSTGVITDNNNDDLIDSFYASGNDEYGQLGNGSNSNIDQLYFVVIYSSDSASIASLDFIYDDNQLFIDLRLYDYSNVVNSNPTVLLVDSGNVNYTTTFISSNSDIPNDQYYYQVNGIERGTHYYFTEIIINDVTSPITEDLITDYIISDYSIESVTEQTATISLNLSENDNVDFSDYTNEQLKVKVNYTDLDQNNSYNQEFTLNSLIFKQKFEIISSVEIELTNLKAETNYQIDSIEYFYENGSYKYQIEQSAARFKTQSVQPTIQSATSLVLDETITSNSFQYTIEIDNLISNSDNTNFTNYDVNDGLWLVDQDGYIYESTFVTKEFYRNGDYSNTSDYIMTYEVNGLLAGEYLFNGASFEQPSEANFEQPLNYADSDVVILDPPMDVIIPDDGYIDPVVLGSTFAVTSVAPTSFQYKISLDDLLLTGTVGSEPLFSNFDQTDGLYLKDSNHNTYHSEYVSATAIDQGSGTEVGTKKYQFSFQVNDLVPDTDYQFNGISPNQNGTFTPIDNGEVHTSATSDDCCFPLWWWVALIIILLLILIVLICLLFKGNSHKEKIKRKETVEVNQQENKNVEPNNAVAANNVKQNKSPARRRTYKKNDDTKKLTEEIAELSKIVQKIDQENKDIKINIQGIGQEGNVQQKRKKVNKKVDDTKELKEEITELSKMVQELNNTNNSKPTKKSKRRNNKTDKLTKEITELSKIVQKIDQENKGIKKDIKEISKKKK
ncbi:/ / ATPase involved in DNA repair / 269867:273538 Forward [Candidatus Hepatoplasma crinochetorum]|uniref:/ / ATPase involved in DNA repair / 269867:273538 Forward n=1 Tax=Candidatus Hepatoplasma crinochetorum TaxID=295596 RepID=A0A0G7ZMM0_9MOLU|nr:/ / ATPase involved in DNA repair / 269867:273538 Forward [Candidatus Hepatoplasma crinochetorum]